MSYLARRLATLVPLLFGITVICFAMVHLAPGDPMQLAADLDPRAKANSAYAENAGLNDPLPVQYLHWLGKISRGDFGISLAADGRPVADKILAALPVTLWINLAGLALTLAFSIPLAIYAATRPYTLADHTLTTLQYVAMATPTVVLALLGLQYFGSHLGWVPLSGMSSYGAESLGFAARTLDLLHHLALPIAVGVIGSLAGLSRFLRGSLIEALQQDYLLTAKAKGASRARVLRHALRNALLPLITILGLSVPGLIGGSVILESLFALPGLGQLFYTAAMMRDYPTIMALLTIGAVLTPLGNLAADLCYAWADPRIRLR